MKNVAFEWGTLKESFLMAMNAVRASKLRSILTLLGIVVGIFSIISVMTAVGVLKQNIESGLSQLGANTFQVQKFSVGFNTTPEQRHKMWNRKNITLEQAQLVKERLTSVEAVAFQASQGGKYIFWSANKTNPNVGVYGVTEEALITNEVTVEVGRGLTSDDNLQGRKVTILGSAVVKKLFPPSVNPVGEFVRIEKGLYQVIGVFAEKASILGGDQNNFVVVPLSVFFQYYGKERTSLTLTVKVARQSAVDDAIEQTRAILRVARKVSPGDEDDFGIFTNDSLITQFNEFTFYLRLGVLVVSSIALLAAGVGIMNIMLVSVTERTREIGVRKAIGARKRDVLQQFMIEAIILCQVGGVLGVVLGVAGGNAVGLLVNAPAIIPWEWVAVGLVSCSVVGFVFGVYPAWKASSLDPIEALRYE
jgi:putative ABC transport system permease protein